MRRVIYVFLIISLTSCSRTNNIAKYNDINARSKTSEQVNNKLPIQYYLKNRVNNCEEAIEYMKALIIPDTVKTGFGFDPESEFQSHFGFIQFEITGESNPNKLVSLERLFVDFECLKSLEPTELFEILCSGSDYEIAFDEFNSERSKSKRYVFEGVVKGMNNFSIVISNNVIENMSWGDMVNSH